MANDERVLLDYVLGTY